MRKILFVTVMALLVLPATYAILPTKHNISKNPTAAELQIPLYGSDKTISLADFLKLTPKGYTKLTGKKLNMKDKLGLSLTKRQMKKCVNKDGTVNLEKLKKLDTEGFNIGGFALGFFLSIIGVLIAYLISKGEQPDLVKWAWIGAAVGLVVYLIIILV
jgi:hypothetical protein